MKTVNLFEVREDTLKTISNLYDRSVESLNEDVAKVKEWMKTQAHLPEILDDKRIQNFLILSKCSVEKAKQNIDAYYTCRSMIPEIYENINPKLPNIAQVMEIMYYIPLPKPTPEMYRVFVSKARNKEMFDILEPRRVIGHVMNVEEVRLKEDVMFGDVFIYDLEGFSLSYMLKFTPSLQAKALAIYEKVFSIPMKAIYIINSPPFISTILSITKTLMKPKLFQRIHVCEDSSILNDNFPKELLPKDYGGELPSLEELQELLKLKFEYYRNRFDQLDDMKVNESLRPTKLENDETLGFYGNFKKLSID